MTRTSSGSCLCGDVAFEVNGEPENTICCFCTHCAKNAGAPSQYSAKFAVTQVILRQGQDLLKTIILKDTLSGYNKHKVFCGKCGCTLWTVPMRHGGQHLIVRTSIIDNGLHEFPPKVIYFAERNLNQTTLEGIKVFATMPGF